MPNFRVIALKVSEICRLKPLQKYDLVLYDYTL